MKAICRTTLISSPDVDSSGGNPFDRDVIVAVSRDCIPGSAVERADDGQLQMPDAWASCGQRDSEWHTVEDLSAAQIHRGRATESGTVTAGASRIHGSLDRHERQSQNIRIARH